MAGDQYRLNYVKDILSIATEGNILLSNEDVLTIIRNSHDYPAFNSLIRVYVYLYFLTEINSAVPREDRFTDSLIMIEYAYCDVIISNDKLLVDKHAVHINPKVKLIKAEEFIQNISNFSLSADLA